MLIIAKHQSFHIYTNRLLLHFTLLYYRLEIFSPIFQSNKMAGLLGGGGGGGGNKNGGLLGG